MTPVERRRWRAVWIVGGVVGMLPGPVVLAGLSGVVGPAFVAGATGPARLAAIRAGWAAWLSAQGWWPWLAWPVLLRHAWLLAADMAGTAVALAVLGHAVLRGRRSRGADLGGPPVVGRGQHGTARWATDAEVAGTFTLWDGRATGQQPRPTGVLLGSAGEGRVWVQTGEGHILLLGATGAGKTRRVILPTLGVIGTAARESMLVTDPKGELYRHAAGWLERQGYQVVRVDLRTPGLSRRWNPVLAVSEALARGRVDEASAHAWDIAHLLATALAPEGGNNQAVWALAAEGLIAALILAVAQGRPPAGGEVPAGEPAWKWPAPAERTMASVNATLLAGGSGGERLADMIRQFPPDHPARTAYGVADLSLAETRASVLFSTAAAMRLFSDVGTAWLTSAQDHSLASMGERLTATFLVIPDERGTRYPLATLYVQQTLQALTEVAVRHGGALPVPVTMLLDEFGNLPKIPDFDKTVSVARSRGIRLLLAVQDLAQLRRHYHEAAHTIMGNLATWIYLATSDIETAELMSRMLGGYTVTAEGASTPRVTWWTASATVGTASLNETLQRRELLTAEEVMRWPKGEVLALRAGRHPARLPLPDLSAYAAVFPGIQESLPDSDPVAVTAPPTWRPPQPHAGRKQSGVATGRIPAPPDRFPVPPAPRGGERVEARTLAVPAARVPVMPRPSRGRHGRKRSRGEKVGAM